MLHNSFYHFVNNMYYILKCFCLYTNTLIIYNNKSNVNSLSTCYENKALCSQESTGLSDYRTTHFANFNTSHSVQHLNTNMGEK